MVLGRRGGRLGGDPGRAVLALPPLPPALRSRCAAFASIGQNTHPNGANALRPPPFRDSRARELEDKLSKPAGDKAAQVMVSFEEGEYLAGKDVRRQARNYAPTSARTSTWGCTSSPCRSRTWSATATRRLRSRGSRP